MLGEIYSALKEAAKPQTIGELETVATVARAVVDDGVRPRTDAAFLAAFEEAKIAETARLASRLREVFAAPGIAGNGTRMVAATALALGGDMGTSDIINFVKGAVDGPAPQPDEISYERVPLASLAMPSAAPALSLGGGDWDDFRKTSSS